MEYRFFDLRCRLAAALLIALSAWTRVTWADCFDNAAAYQHVNPTMLRAIVWQESHGVTSALHSNTNGSVDVGLAQINSVHFPTLATYGIAPTALYNGCVNVYVAAWLLKQKMNKYGNTWQAVGAYHSETPDKRDAYARSIHAILVAWGKVPAS